MSMRRNLRLRPVNSVKHIVDTNGAISAALVSTTDVIQAVDNPALGSPQQVATGSTVHSIFLRVEAVGIESAGGVDNIYMLVYKNPGANVAGPRPDAAGTSDNKKRVIHQEMLMLAPRSESGAGGGDARFPRTLFKGVVRIPRGLKRFGYEDKLQVVISHRVGEMTQLSEFCLQCIYKEFR